MRKITALILLAIIVLASLSSCSCKHVWKAADCINPKTCTKCRETEGIALGHNWKKATCIDPKTCSVCGETEGSALGHTWQPATCASPKKCKSCGITEGSKLSTHSLRQGYCAVCGSFINELPQVVDFLKETINDCSVNIVNCRLALDIATLSTAFDYFNEYIHSLRKILYKCNKHPKEFVKFTTLISEIYEKQQVYIDQYNSSSSTAAKRAALSSALKIYSSLELSSILNDDYTKP